MKRIFQRGILRAFTARAKSRPFDPGRTMSTRSTSGWPPWSVNRKARLVGIFSRQHRMTVEGQHPVDNRKLRRVVFDNQDRHPG